VLVGLLQTLRAQIDLSCFPSESVQDGIRSAETTCPSAKVSESLTPERGAALSIRPRHVRRTRHCFDLSIF
jgi:hypothetical protein